MNKLSKKFGRVPGSPTDKPELQNKPGRRRDDLVFDIGFHTGQDARYYMDKGYSVLGIEANPKLAQNAMKRFSKEIADGQLILKNVGIHTTASTLEFYINDSVDEWSSFDAHLGTRTGKYHTIDVPCVTLASLVSEFGVPKYAKIDVEGLDGPIVRTVADFPIKPQFVSVEDAGIDTLVSMYEAGVRQFKFTNQPYWHSQPRGVAGPDADASDPFGPSSSGPFGEDIPCEWIDAHEAFKFYFDNVRPVLGKPTDGWWDIHGKFA